MHVGIHCNHVHIINLLAAIDTRRLITNNTNACNAVVRATACIAQELTLGIPCNVTGITN